MTPVVPPMSSAQPLAPLASPHRRPPIAPARMVASLYASRELVARLVRREIAGRYRGSLLGIAWSFLVPALMLAVYTFVFTVVFESRLGAGPGASKSELAIAIFAGMITHGLLAEVLNRAPGLVVSNVSYVKKVVFPLEILPVVAMGTALFHYAASLVVLLVALAVTSGHVHATVLLAPLVVAPLVLLGLGLAWLLASLGVFVRDIGQTIGLVTLVLIFLSPVFYPLEALPETLRPWLLANPLTFIIEQTRETVVHGRLPDWTGLAVYTLAGACSAWLGHAWFQRTRKGFADVL